MTTPIIYRSDDASAPVLVGNAGGLITVLDACLVNGYGAKAAAGWTKPFSGTNLAAYLMGTGGTSRRMYLRVDDTGGPGARIRGFDDMTNVNTGTEPFPTVGQVGGSGIVHWKSNAANATARPWILIATPWCFYLSTQCDQTVLGTNQGTQLSQTFFGQYTRYTPVTFVHNVALIGGTPDNNNSSTGAAFGSINAPNNFSTPLFGGNFACRGENNAVGAVALGKTMAWGVPGLTTITTIGHSHGIIVPDPASGKVYGSRVFLVNPGSQSLLGHMPGLWVPINSSSSYVGGWLDTIDGSGPLAGRTLLIAHATGATGTTIANVIGRVCFDTTTVD